MSFNVYDKLHTACVTPILYYGANISGMHPWNELESVQMKASRVFLRDRKLAPHAAMEGDILGGRRVKQGTNSFR